MGNQLVALAPGQIFPVEHYITDIQDTVKYESSLGSTRFFKVARCGTESGSVVVKVFVIHDASLAMASYQAGVAELLRLLGPTFNCLPYTKAFLTDKAGFLVRQFTKYSLYDRISTRPFLTQVSLLTMFTTVTITTETSMAILGGKEVAGVPAAAGGGAGPRGRRLPWGHQA